MVQLMPSLAPGTEARTRELDQLLNHLRKAILHPDSQQEQKLSTSDFERSRVSANLTYARDLLTRLEQEALSIQGPGRKQNVQAELLRKKEVLDQLLDRMRDLAHMEVAEEDSESEDILADIIPTPSESIDSLPARDEQDIGGAAQTTPSPPVKAQNTAVELPEPRESQPPTTTSQTLRVRMRPDPTSETSHTTARQKLFSNRGGGRSSATTMTTTATAEAIMDHHRAEQEALSDSILRMASRLKESSKDFSKTLEDDKAIMEKAGESVDATGRRMDAAGRRMGVLAKLTEGKGWWGRMLLFAQVYGLMVAVILVVFVLPKLRF